MAVSSVPKAAGGERQHWGRECDVARDSCRLGHRAAGTEFAINGRGIGAGGIGIKPPASAGNRRGSDKSNRGPEFGFERRTSGQLPTREQHGKL
jgi:hypothetical protein